MPYGQSSLAKQPKLSARQLHNEAVFWIPRRVHPLFYDQIAKYLRTLEITPDRIHETHTITQALDSEPKVHPYRSQRRFTQQETRSQSTKVRKVFKKRFGPYLILLDSISHQELSRKRALKRDHE